MHWRPGGSSWKKYWTSYLTHHLYRKSIRSISRALISSLVPVHCVPCVASCAREKETSRPYRRAVRSGRCQEDTGVNTGSPDPRDVKARVWVRPARARASVSRSTYGSHLVFCLSLWAIRTPGCGSFGFLLYLPLFSSGSSMPAPQARPRCESVLPSRFAKTRSAAWKKKKKKPFADVVFARTMNLTNIIIDECTAANRETLPWSRKGRELRISFLCIINYTRRKLVKRFAKFCLRWL